MKLIICCLSY